MQIMGNTPEYLKRSDVPNSVIDELTEKIKKDMGSDLTKKPPKI